jgi:hypothetical protein
MEIIDGLFMQHVNGTPASYSGGPGRLMSNNRYMVGFEYFTIHISEMDIDKIVTSYIRRHRYNLNIIFTSYFYLSGSRFPKGLLFITKYLQLRDQELATARNA